MKMKEIKVKFLEALLAILVATFAPIKAVIVITGVLILADTITGMLAARKRGEKISSAGLRRTVTKSLVYLSAVCLGFLVEHYMIEDFLPISKIISGVISIVELKSILENLDSINGSSLFKTVIERLGSVNDKKQD
jgi:Na+/H+ antiporter NhaD/arsenite permease-like protein